MSEPVPFADLTEFLKTKNPLLQQLIDALPMPIFYKDIHGVYLGCNTYFEDYIQLPRDQLIGFNVYELFDPELAATYDKADQALFEEKGIQTYEAAVRSEEGNEFYVKFHKSCFYHENGDVAGLIGAIFDITEQKKLERSLLRLASYDELTGLYNRREGIRRAEDLFATQARGDGTFCMLMIDVDYFKRINDEYGHQCGDRALVFIADQLKAISRSSDVVVRYGGEEFVILLPATDRDAARVIAERYRASIAGEPFQFEDQKPFTLAVSIGLSVSKGQSLKALFKEADDALYRAKSLGRNRVQG